MEDNNRLSSYIIACLFIVISLLMAENSRVFAQNEFRTGEITFDKEQYEITETATVTVTDKDLNLNANSPEIVSIDVWSDTDSAGIRLQMVETGDSSGVFVGSLYFTATDSSSGQRLRVSVGDYITAAYEDHTADDIETVTAVSQISNVNIIPAQNIKLENINIVDSFGNPIQKVYVNNQVMVSADVVSLSDSEQSYYFVLRVTDNEGKIVAGSEWKDVPLQPFQTLNNALSWTPTEAGRYTTTLSVWDRFPGGTNLAVPLFIVVDVTQLEPENESPTAKISKVSDQIEEGIQINLSASGSSDKDGIITAYLWDFGDGISATGRDVSHIYEKSGSYAVKLTVTDNKGAEDTEVFTLTVTVKNQMPIAKISGPNKAKVDSEIFLTAEDSFDPDGGIIKRYDWDMGDGNTKMDQRFTYSYSNSGTYSIRLIVTDDEGYQDQDTLTIVIEPPIRPEVIAGAGGGAVAATVAALTQIPKPIPKPARSPGVTLSVMIRNVRVELK